MRVAVVVVVVLSCPLAHAEPPGVLPLAPPGLTPVAPVVPRAEAAPIASYRAWTLGMDAVAVTSLLVATRSDDHADGFVVFSVGTYLGGAPFVHLAKGRNGHALASATMRIGFPLLGAIIGDNLRNRATCDGVHDECYDDDIKDEVALGVIAGLLAAMVVDTAYLAEGDPPRAEPAPTWTPNARVTHGGLTLGIAGNF